MKVIAISLIVHAPDPVTGEQVSTHQRFAQVVRAAEFSELIGLDGFGVGERHERPFISSAPTVVLSHLAARTKRPRLFTAVTTLSLLDPVRAYEDYATLDHLSEGRLERFGHTVLHVGADAQGISEAAHRESLELFAEAVLPALRTDIPDPPVWGPGELVDDGIRGGAPAGETFLATG